MFGLGGHRQRCARSCLNPRLERALPQGRQHGTQPCLKRAALSIHESTQLTRAVILAARVPRHVVPRQVLPPSDRVAHRRRVLEEKPNPLSVYHLDLLLRVPHCQPALCPAGGDSRVA